METVPIYLRITKYFEETHPNPDMNYGIGGATQAITNTPISDYILNGITK